MTKNSIDKNDLGFLIAIAVAVLNLGLFGIMFGLMGYFELIGADQSFFDEGTRNNLKIINSILQFTGITIDADTPRKVSTLGYSICLGVALTSTFFAIVIGNRRPVEEYEVTVAKP
jgi:hypothetical protein